MDAVTGAAEPALPLVAHPRIAIVEDHELLAESLAYALARQGFDPVCVAPASDDEVLGQLAAADVDVVLLDLNLGEIGSALPLIAPLRAGGTRVIVMTGETNRAVWGECIEAGAAAIVTKTAPFEQLLDRIARLASGEHAIDVRERAELLDALRAARRDERVRLEPFRRLSVRECEVLHDLMQGMNVDAIAEAAFVSVSTVRTHVQSILRKLEVTSQLAAVALAMRADWTSPHQRPEH